MRPAEQEWDISPEDGHDDDVSKDEFSDDERSSESDPCYGRPPEAKHMETLSHEEIDSREETIGEATVLKSNEMVRRDNFRETDEEVNTCDVDEIRQEESLGQTDDQAKVLDIGRFPEQHDHREETEEDDNILDIDHILQRRVSRRSIEEEEDERDDYLVLREDSNPRLITVQHSLDYWERWIKDVFNKHGIEES